MKACCYCDHGREDDQGTFCGIDWDSAEYLPKERYEKIRKECRDAQKRRDAAEKKEVSA